MIEFHYPEDLDDFNLLIETFQKKKKKDDDRNNEDSDEDNNFVFGQKKEFDKFIAMDDVSGLADKSGDFSRFLTVSRKFGYGCL